MELCLLVEGSQRERTVPESPPAPLQPEGDAQGTLAGLTVAGGYGLFLSSASQGLPLFLSGTSEVLEPSPHRPESSLVPLRPFLCSGSSFLGVSLRSFYGKQAGCTLPGHHRIDGTPSSWPPAQPKGQPQLCSFSTTATPDLLSQPPAFSFHEDFCFQHSPGLADLSQPAQILQNILVNFPLLQRWVKNKYL